MKIAITGHRPNKLGNDYDLTSELIQKIKAKLGNILNFHKVNAITFDRDLILITGMALGIDTLFAQIAIENKDVSQFRRCLKINSLTFMWCYAKLCFKAR